MVRSIEERKDHGIFYTPPFLAEYLAKKFFIYAKKKAVYSVLDPACGDGELLSAITKQNVGHAKLDLVGTDNDTTVSEEIKTKLFDGGTPKKRFTFISVDSLNPFSLDPASGWLEIKNQVGVDTGFDFVISNPPWGADLSSYPKGYLHDHFKCSRGQFDIFDLFVELIINQLSQGGLYGLIIPDSIFNKEHSLIREILVKNTRLLLIARLGEKVFPEINRACTVIVGKKCKYKKQDTVKCFKISAEQKKKEYSATYLEELEQENSSLILQDRFVHNEGFAFDIDVVNESEEVFRKVENKSTLGCYVRLNRGAEISKKGTITKCHNCGLWFSYPRKKNYHCPHCYATGVREELNTISTVSSKSTEGAYPLVTGSDIFRYFSRSKLFITTGFDGIKYKMSLYGSPKILIRKTGLGITSAIDYTDAVTVQCIYILRPLLKYSRFPIELFEAILNSRFATFYFLKKYGDTEWKSHPYLTQSMLRGFPFPELEKLPENQYSRILRLSEKIREEVRSGFAENISTKLDILVERMVAELYKLNKEDYVTILDGINKADQLIPIKRVNNLSVQQIFNDGI